MSSFVRLTGVVTALGLAWLPVSAFAGGDVVTTIKPVHSLVAGVMKGVGDPHLIVKGAASPHSYALRPSDARALEGAKVIFWVGDGLETFLEGPLKSLGKKAKIVALSKAHGVKRLSFREDGPWEGHDHGDHGDEKHAEHKHDHDKHGHEKHAEHKHDHDKHGHEKHAEHKHDHDKHGHEKHAEHKHDHDKHGHEKHAEHKHDHDKHGHEKHAEHKHDHDKHGHEKHAEHKHDHEDHGHGHFDMHLWLDPANAKAMVHEIAEALSAADPANASRYKSNGEALEKRLASLIQDTAKQLKPVKGRPFVVFHDAFQYFEKRFGLNAVGSITVSPEVIPGARRVGEIKKKIGKLGAVCVFSEPQFEPKLVGVVTEGTKAKTGTLDPLGADLPDGPDLYFKLIERNAKMLADCLGKTS